MILMWRPSPVATVTHNLLLNSVISRARPESDVLILDRLIREYKSVCSLRSRMPYMSSSSGLFLPSLDCKPSSLGRVWSPMSRSDASQPPADWCFQCPFCRGQLRWSASHSYTVCHVSVLFPIRGTTTPL